MTTTARQLATALGSEFIRVRIFGEAPLVLANRYRLDKVLGRGATGVVVGGFDSRMGQPVALKLTTPSSASEQMLVEARALAHVRSARHPHVVQVYEVAQGRIVGRSLDVVVDYIVMEFVEGRTLRTFLAENALAPATALSIFASIANALAFVHAHGIVHGDVKPDNILVRPDGSPVVVDFAFARSVVGARGGVRSSFVFGTPPYIAPESTEGRIRRRGDVFSLAMVFWEAWTGAVPFAGPIAPQSALGRVLTLPGEEKVPRTLRTLMKRAMRKHPSARPHAAHLAEAFHRAARDAAPRTSRARRAAIVVAFIGGLGLLMIPEARRAVVRSTRTRMVAPATLSLGVDDTNSECKFATRFPVSLALEPVGLSRMQGWLGSRRTRDRVRIDWVDAGLTRASVSVGGRPGELTIRWGAFRATSASLTLDRDEGTPSRCAVAVTYADVPRPQP